MSKPKVDREGRTCGKRGCEHWMERKARFCNAAAIVTTRLTGANRSYCTWHQPAERVPNDGGDDVGA